MKKTNIYKNMRTNIGNLTPAQFQFRIHHFIQNELAEALDDAELLDYANDEMEPTYNKIEKYSRNFLKCVCVNNADKLNEVYDYVNNFNFNGDSKQTLIMQAYFDKSTDVFIKYITRIKAFDEKCEEFMQKYIIPILSNEEKIVFDINSTDEEIKKKTDDTLKILSILVGEKGSLGACMKYGYLEFSEEDDKLISFLYIDDEEYKKEIATGLCNDFISRYDKIDFTNIKDFNSKKFYLL